MSSLKTVDVHPCLSNRTAQSLCEFVRRSTANDAPTRLVLCGAAKLELLAASANVLEGDTERRIGPPPLGCPSTHLSAFTTTDFPLPAALRTTKAQGASL